MAQPAPEDEEDILRPCISMNMNQSIFGVLAAAASKQIDFNDRFPEGSDDEDDGGGRPAPAEGDGFSSHGRAIDEAGPTDLAKKLKDIFEFETAEEVITEYPCWLLQHVLLQGYMYITTKHIAFYAYLPKKAHEVAKSGYLSKSGKRNPKYHRYWFRLKGDVLAYYRDSKNLYFPSGQIDLRYAVSAAVTDKAKDGVHFSVATPHRTYHFRADSAPSANEWVKCLQRVIFRSHNDGDSVKISLPMENVIDIEETAMLDFADTCKMRVIENDETYAIDEYFFSFFSLGKEAVHLLKMLVEDGDATKRGAEAGVESGEPRGRLARCCAGGHRLHEGVRATLGAMPASRGGSTREPSPWAGSDHGRPRSSLDALRRGRRAAELMKPSQDSLPRRSFGGLGRTRSRSTSRTREGAWPNMQTDSGSYARSSMDEHSQNGLSSLAMASGSDDASASQILRGSDVFHSPTMPRSASGSRGAGAEAATRPGARGLASRLAKSSAPPGSARPVDELVAEVADAGVADDPSDDPGFPSPHQGLTATHTLPRVNFSRMAGLPLKTAGAWMGYTRKMSTILATESMGYVEKVSGMWKGGKKHYHEPAELNADEEDNDVDPDNHAASNSRFRQHFTLPDGETLQAAYFAYMIRVLPLYGKIYISDRHFCFRSLLPGTRTKLILPLKDIETTDKETGFRFGFAGLVVVIRGHEELFFEFGKADVRDDCAITLLQKLEAVRFVRDAALPGSGGADDPDTKAALAERDALQSARWGETGGFGKDGPTILFDSQASMLNFQPSMSMRITCLTVGSRGDVQPYIALCKALQLEGHRPRIATHAEFQSWIEGHGIDFGLVEGDPSVLMRLCIDNGTFTWAWLKEANSKLRSWIDDLLASAWTACQGSDLIIESPSAMAGIHIAEALNVPYFRAFGMPWTRTRSYPHAFIVPGQKLGGAYNYVTYVMFDNVFWKATAHQINRWRNLSLGLPSTSLEKLQTNKVPFLYSFSPSVVPPPLDYPDWIRVTGYWFLDEASDWTPPEELVLFIEQARRDRKKIVYVGFGSIIVPDPAKMTQEVVDAVLKADVRCILSKGWSDRVLEAAMAGETDQAAPSSALLQIKSAPHDWLFGQIDAAAHHGGSGTTGASLRAGIPVIVRPFFGDQYFFGNRVEELGVGVCLKKWGAHSFGKALWEVTHNERVIGRARRLGEEIRREKGVERAVQAIYRDLEYAKSLIQAKNGTSSAAAAAPGATGEEESWTFLEEEGSGALGSLPQSQICT